MKILIIKLGALGDVIMATAAIKAILDHHEGHEFWILTTPPFEHLFHNWNGLKVHCFHRKGLINLLKISGWIRRQRFARIYDLQSNDRSAVICALSGVKEIVGNHRRFSYTHTPTEPWSGQKHIVERLCDVLASAGIRNTELRPFFPIEEASVQKIAAWLKARQLDRQSIVLMHAGSSPQWTSKRWPYYSELSQTLEKRGLCTLWIGATDDMEINRDLSAVSGVDATNEFSVAELMALAKHARFAVTNDSAPMHIIATANIPIYAFFGPSNWQLNHAIGQRDRVFFSIEDCTGCRLKDRRHAIDHSCLKNISVTTVLERLERDALIGST